MHIEEVSKFYKELEEWAKTQKRVTNKMIRGRFDVDEDNADLYYNYLKASGIIKGMGYVVNE